MFSLEARSVAPPMVQSSEKVLPRSAAPAAPSVAREDGKLLDVAMDRYARGEDAAFDELFRNGAPRLRTFLLRMGGDLALADDLTQEAFLRVHLARGSFLAGSAALPWMLAIARNVFLDHARRASVRRSVGVRVFDGKEPPHPEASPETRGDEVLSARETLDIVRRTLATIPVPQREAFVLLRFEGLSVSQAAVVLGATEAAVKVRAFRAYEALRAALHREGDTARAGHE